MKKRSHSVLLIGLTVTACAEATSPDHRAATPPAPGANLTIVAPALPGALYTFGQNTNYALGLGDLKNRPTPTLVGNQSTWTTVAEATETGVALQSDGTLWGWGRNDFGQIGVGDKTNRPVPVKVGTQTDWVGIGVGRLHTIALKADGTIWTWGAGQNGSLGLGGTSDRLVPTQVGTQNDGARVSAGYTRSFVIKIDGSLWGFGGNTNGSLGTGVGSGRFETPIQIGTSTLWSQVGTSNVGNHSAGVRTDGSLWTWGTGSSGQLGLGNTQDKYSPTQVGTLNNWAKVSAGGSHTLAIKSDGTLWAWGSNAKGQLGVAGKTRTIPIQVGTAADWKAVRATAGFGGTGLGSSAAIR